MYLDALEFLEEERDAFRPYEALNGLTDAQLSAAVVEMAPVVESIVPLESSGWISMRM